MILTAVVGALDRLQKVLALVVEVAVAEEVEVAVVVAPVEVVPPVVVAAEEVAVAVMKSLLISKSYISFFFSKAWRHRFLESLLQLCSLLYGLILS